MIVDILVLVVLLISGLIAFLRGFIREVLTIAGVVGGLAASYVGGPLLIPFMNGWMGVKEGEEPGRLFDILPLDLVANIVSYGLIFIVVVIALSVLSHFLAETARSIGLGAIDRTLGFVFGLVRGLVLLAILYLPLHLFIDKEAKAAWFGDSKTHFYLERLSQSMAELIPQSATDEAKKGLDKIEGVTETRKRLEEINLLKGKDAPPENPPNGDLNAPASETSPPPPAGYNNEFREKMDELFEEQTTEPEEAPPVAAPPPGNP